MERQSCEITDMRWSTISCLVRLRSASFARWSLMYTATPMAIAMRGTSTAAAMPPFVMACFLIQFSTLVTFDSDEVVVPISDASVDEDEL